MSCRQRAGVVALFLALLVSFPSGERTTQALLTASASLDNVITLCTNRIIVEETYDPPDIVVPGTRFTKKPVFKNQGDAPCLVRARVVFSHEKAEQLCLLTGTGEGWTRVAGEEYYYYATSLEKGMSTTPLFQEVLVDPDASIEEVESALPFDITVYAESVLFVEGTGTWDLVKGGSS